MTVSDNRQNVDPALWPLVEAFPPIELSAATLPAFRAALKEMSVLPDASTHQDVRISQVQVPSGSDGSRAIRCLLFLPAQGVPAGALLHVHGGGFVMGTVEMDAARNVQLARDTGCAILSVDYRLAPEHPHPAGLEDCHSALLWLAAQGPRLGFPGSRIGVIGESAGGGLAASLALLARDRASVPLACQALIYPMLLPPAQSVEAALPDPGIGQFIWTRSSDAFAWSANLPEAGVASGTIAGLAADLAALPPAFLAVGQLDLFVHDNLVHVGRMLRAGVPVEAHVYPGAIHGFDRAVDASVTQRFTLALTDFLRRHVGLAIQAPK